MHKPEQFKGTADRWTVRVCADKPVADRPAVWFSIDCGTMSGGQFISPDEADAMADALRFHANAARELFAADATQAAQTEVAA